MSPFSSPEFPPAETRQPPPAWSHTLVLYAYLAAPLSPFGAGGDRPVGDSEPSLTAHLQQAPSNAWLSAPESACLGAPAPGVFLPECAASSS